MLNNNHAAFILLVNHPKIDVNKPGSLLFTPLLLAAFHGRTKMVKKLLKQKANPNQTNIHDNTPLHSALNGIGTHEIIQLLVDYGTDTKAINKDGETPLAIAQRLKKPEQTIRLLQQN